MKRIVIAPIHIDQATKAAVLLKVGERSSMFNSDGWMDLTDADQLTRDLDEVTRSTLGSLEQEGDLGHDGLALRDMALRLRAAASLDADDE